MFFSRSTAPCTTPRFCYLGPAQASWIVTCCDFVGDRKICSFFISFFQTKMRPAPPLAAPSFCFCFRLSLPSSVSGGIRMPRRIRLAWVERWCVELVFCFSSLFSFLRPHKKYRQQRCSCAPATRLVPSALLLCASQQPECQPPRLFILSTSS